MKRPIEVRVIEGIGYVRYGDEATVDYTREIVPDCSVSADIDANGAIIGIELLSLTDPAVYAIARDYAHANGVAFPLDFAGVLAVA